MKLAKFGGRDIAVEPRNCIRYYSNSNIYKQFIVKSKIDPQTHTYLHCCIIRSRFRIPVSISLQSTIRNANEVYFKLDCAQLHVIGVRFPNSASNNCVPRFNLFNMLSNNKIYYPIVVVAAELSQRE